MKRPLASNILLPPPEKAFPFGGHDMLIKAAADCDDQVAIQHARAWLAANNIEDAPFRDLRLLVTVAARFGDRLAADPAYPRLVGKQRMLWAQAHLTWHEAHSVMAAMHRTGIDLLLIKGAARIIEDKASIHARAARDIDVVVRPSQGVEALDILGAEGWVANKGVSHQYLREHLDSIRSINLLKGERGDIDLHLFPFRPGQGGREEDEELWKRTSPAEASGVPVFLPCAEDRLALAIALGSLEGHQHSDWLVDSAVLVSSGRIRWDLFERVVEQRELAAPATIAMHYIAKELHHDVPRETLVRLATAARARPLEYWSSFLQTRPPYRASALGELARSGAVGLRRRAEKRTMPPRSPDRRLRVREIRDPEDGTLPSPVAQHRFRIPEGGENDRHLHIRALMHLTVPPIRRRIELEINGRRQHCCRIRYRKLAKLKTAVVLEVEGTFEAPLRDDELILESRSSRHVREADDAEHRQRYGAIPFRLLSFEVRPGNSEETAADRVRPTSVPSRFRIALEPKAYSHPISLFDLYATVRPIMVRAHRPQPV